jgi:starch phosphorylase
LQSESGLIRVPMRQVYAVAYDNPIPGWKTENAINLRLWAGEPVEEFDLASFNVGEYTQSRAASNTAATISAVLYPEDSTPAGKMLRLKQQFFFTSASLQVTARLEPSSASCCQ